MKKLATIAYVAMISLSAATAPARAAQLQVDVDITLPEILILYCYNQVNVDISAAQLATLLSAGALAPDGTRGEQLTLANPDVTPDSVTTTDISVTLDAANETGATSLASPTLTLNNLCAVRGLVNGGTADVEVVSGPASLDNGASSIETINWATTSPTVTNVSLGTAQPISVTADLDLSGVTLAGLHSSGTALVVEASMP